MIIQFGKFKGQEIENIPTSYLTWCLENATLDSKTQGEMENQLQLRDGGGVARSKDYVERHSMRFKEDEQE